MRHFDQFYTLVLGEVIMALSVFISSTSRDLQTHRAAVKAAIERLEMRPIDMVNFGSQPGDAVGVSLDQVCQADLFVGIIAHRYGYVPEGMGRSVTEQEYDEAVRKGIPRLMYLVDPEHEWPQEFIEADDEAQRKLAAFKTRVETETVRSLFTTPENLAQQVTADLARLIAMRKRRRVTWATIGVALLMVPLIVLALFANQGTRSSLIEMVGLASATPTATPTPIPQLPDYDVGLGVAFFTVPEDQSVTLDEADTLIEQVDVRLQGELDSFSDTTGLTLGHLGPQDLGRIVSDDARERAVFAREVAERHDADVILYGIVSRGRGGILEVQPEFYVSPTMFTDALEMTGSYRLGSAIEVTGSLDDMRNALVVNQPLSARTTALAQIFAGLTYYELVNYDEALKAFEAAESALDWEITDGHEVLLVLLGNTRLKLAGEAIQARDPDEARDWLTQAQFDFETAATLAPEYARAYAGLGSAKFVEWNIELIETGLPDIAYLEKALDYLDQADDALDQPEDVGARTAPLATRLTVNYNMLVYHSSEVPDDLDAIMADFLATSDLILRRYDNGRNLSMQPVAAETHVLRGHIYFSLAGDCLNALDDFDAALDLSLSPRRQMFINGWRGDCYLELNQTAQAAEAYFAALQIANALDDVLPMQLDYYNAQLNALDS